MQVQETAPINLLSKQELVREIIRPVRRRTRFYNHLLDLIFFYMIMFTSGIILGSILVFTEADPTSLNGNSWLPWLDNLLGFGMFLAYYITFEGLFGKTIGKMITNTKVVRPDGTKPSFKSIVGRSFARLIPFEAFSLLSPNPRGWHDTLSNTMVVEDIALYNIDNRQAVAAHADTE